MSDFGSSGLMSALVVGALIVQPWLGWLPLLTVVGIGALLTYVLIDVNSRFNPDGTRKRRPGNGRGKRSG